MQRRIQDMVLNCTRKFLWCKRKFQELLFCSYTRGKCGIFPLLVSVLSESLIFPSFILVFSFCVFLLYQKVYLDASIYCC